MSPDKRFEILCDHREGRKRLTADELARHGSHATRSGYLSLAWEFIEELALLDWQRGNRAADVWSEYMDKQGEVVNG